MAKSFLTPFELFRWVGNMFKAFLSQCFWKIMEKRQHWDIKFTKVRYSLTKKTAKFMVSHGYNLSLSLRKTCTTLLLKSFQLSCFSLLYKEQTMMKTMSMILNTKIIIIYFFYITNFSTSAKYVAWTAFLFFVE